MTSHMDTCDIVRGASSQERQPTNPLDLGYQQTVSAFGPEFQQKADTVVTEPKVQNASALSDQPPLNYQPDWLAAEEHDITDQAYYDHDAHETTAVYSHRTAAWAEKESESGGSSPELPCQDLSVRLLDVGFYMALLGGSEPPRASPEAETTVCGEWEMRRRREETDARERERRRREELETNEGDLDFFASLASMR